MSAASYESILKQFRAESGLYMLGAGTSAGSAPLGRAFWTAASIDFLCNVGGFSCAIPAHSELTQRIIEGSSNLSLSEIFPGRVFRFGSDAYPFREILDRLPNYFARLHLKHLLAKTNFSRKPIDSYLVFRQFGASLIANYNHDGLAARFCGAEHRVLAMHGDVDQGYGAPQVASLLEIAREHHFTDNEDGIIMGVPESLTDPNLAQKLQIVGGSLPRFIAIIGYSFGRREAGHDDWVSFEYLKYAFRRFCGNIFVIGLEPEYLRDTLADSIRSKNVFAVRAHWNILAHAFMETLDEPLPRKSLRYRHEKILDKYGGNITFPLDRGK